ncbi:MAG TPA: hypothetical protein VMZ27_14530, partial [Candidatus Saccharimonadales bacterium]|nr:hypothetical protein [Candidatus Saccharimonadales bacterium]
SDRCEDLAFNSFPAALTPDWKGLHYLTCANSVQLDKNNKAPDIENGGTMLSYSPFEGYRCCQHNVSHGWPYFAEELWLATPDHGLCASLYAASEVSANVANGTHVTISEETDYPFTDTISFKISAATPVAFPLHVRIPHWCEKASAKINGKQIGFKAKPSSYAVVERTWKSGDVLTLQLPMKLKTRTWAKNNNSVSVDYGPLTFSLKIGEKWTRYGKNENWPEWEVYPTTPWNYGLEPQAGLINFEVVHKSGPLAENPFKPETVPIELKGKARKIPAWTQDKLGMVGKLQMSPTRSDEPIEIVSLIPMGAARLRVTAFPVIGRGSDAHEWVKASAPPIIASHCFSNDSVEAMVDGIDPKSSNDNSKPRFTWWDHRGTEEWVEWGFPKKRKVSGVDVYWFDDTGKGACRVPKSWTVLYRSGESWKPVEAESGFDTKLNSYNIVAFKPVEAEGLRLEVRLQPEFSGGILEWKIRD